MGNFQLSDDGVTWVDTPVEPRVEYEPGEELRKRADGQIVAFGAPKLRWYFADQPIIGEDFDWFLSWITGNNLSTSIYVKSKIPETSASNGAPEVRTMTGIMGRPRGDIDTETVGGQRFENVEIEFWNLQETP